MGQSILDSLKLTNTFAPSTNTPNKKSDFWLNIGYMAEDGQHFVSLTKGGVPLDNMEPEEVSNPDTDYGQLLLAQNALLEAIKNVAKQLQPGETKLLEGLTVQLRRKKDTVTTMTEGATNRFLKAMNW